MKPSISSFYFGELAPERMVQLFAKHDWEHLELSSGHAHDLLTRGDPVVVGARFRQYAADHGLSFRQGHLANVRYSDADRSKGREGYVDVAPASEREFARVMDVVKRWIDLFSAIGIRFGVLHMGGFRLSGAGWPDEDVFRRRVEALSRIAGFATGGDTTVCLENMSFPNCGVETLDKIVALIEAVRPCDVAVCLDTGHTLLSGVDGVEFIRSSGPRLKAMHIHENIGPKDDHVLPYEQGTIPWDQVLAALSQIGYKGLFSLEIPGRPLCPMPIREARLDYALELVSYMVNHAPGAGSSGGGLSPERSVPEQNRV